MTKQQAYTIEAAFSHYDEDLNVSTVDGQGDKKEVWIILPRIEHQLLNQFLRTAREYKYRIEPQTDNSVAFIVY